MSEKFKQILASAAMLFAVILVSNLGIEYLAEGHINRYTDHLVRFLGYSIGLALIGGYLIQMVRKKN